MYQKQCAVHTLYDCFVNVPFTSIKKKYIIKKIPLDKFEVEKFQGGDEIFR